MRVGIGQLWGYRYPTVGRVGRPQFAHVQWPTGPPPIHHNTPTPSSQQSTTIKNWCARLSRLQPFIFGEVRRQTKFDIIHTRMWMWIGTGILSSGYNWDACILYRLQITETLIGMCRRVVLAVFDAADIYNGIDLRPIYSAYNEDNS